MPTIEWIIVAVLACLVVVFAVLWMRARTGVPVDSAALPAETECTLLAKSQVSIGGAQHHYGVVSPPDGRVVPFLMAQDMAHLQVGDVFSLRNGQAYKVEIRNSAANTTSAASEPAEQLKQSESAQSQSMQSPEVDSLAADQPVDDDLSQRTVLYMEEKDTLPDLEKAFPFLEVVEGSDAGMRFPLPYGDAGIGRSEDNAVALSDNGASRQHCLIEFSETEFLLQDLGSTNGTFHNGEEVTGKRSLEFGDKIEVSDSVLVFNCDGFLLKDDYPDAAIDAFGQCLEQEPDFLQALKNLAFLLERDVRRKKEAEPIWKRISSLEKGR